MNKDLIREKLSNTIETIEQTKTILELNYEKKYEVDFTSYKRREELDKLITKIRMNTLDLDRAKRNAKIEGRNSKIAKSKIPWES